MKPDVSRIEAQLAANLQFYEGLRLKKRLPKTAVQRQFQDVAWGKAEPATDHEYAYVHYLRRAKIGHFAPPSAKPHIDNVLDDHTVGSRPVNGSVGQKWDNTWRGRYGGREFW